MLIANYFLLLTAYGYYHLSLKDQINWENIWCIALGAGFSDGFQAIAHYNLAMRYRLIATEVPAAIEGRDPPEPSRFATVFF